MTEIMRNKIMQKSLSNIDVLIDGRFQSKSLSTDNLVGSTNQKHHFLTNRYTIDDFTKKNLVEYHFSKDGNVKMTGFPVNK
jgi:anaerobic ribonucleoside-triphosphate reductase activating protein